MVAPTQVQLRRGTAAQIAAFTGAQGELVADTDNNRCVLHDGATAGGFQLPKFSEIGIIPSLIRGVNFNAGNSDNIFSILLPKGYSTFLVNSCRLGGATGSLTSATCGVFTGPGGTGTAIVTSGTAVTVSTAASNTNNNSQGFTINNGGSQSYNLATLYFRVQTPEGVAAFANVVLFVFPEF